MKIYEVKLQLTARGKGKRFHHESVKFKQPGITCHALYFLKKYVLTWCEQTE